MADSGVGQAATQLRPAAPAELRRILVVDDHRTFAELLGSALETQPDLTCVGWAANSAEATEMVDRLTPDVVVMDARLGGEDGLELTARLVREWPDLCVVVLTAHSDPIFVVRAAAAGACGFLSKDGALSEALRTVRTARAGRLALPPALLATLPPTPRAGKVHDRRTAPRRPVDLTPREGEVLRLLAAGLDARSISRRLSISVHTSRGYVKSLLAKLHAHTQLEAVANARRSGLLGAD